MQEAAARVIAAQQRQAEGSDESTPLIAAGAVAASKEECRTVVLETQELARKLTKSELKRMAHKLAEQDHACVSTSGAPLSMLDAETLPTCFLDVIRRCGPKHEGAWDGNNGAVHVPMEDIFKWLQDREELEYSLPSDAAPFKARTTSRFDTPEITAIFGSVLRHVLILRGVSTVFRRQGYEADVRQIAKASAADCVEALCGVSRTTGQQASGSVSAAKPARQRGIDQLAYAPDVPENLRKALRQVLFRQ